MADVKGVAISLYSVVCILISSPLFKSDEEQLISQTTSQYPLKQTETTQEEIAAPGKLPETPLRMDPDLLYDVRYDDEFDDREPSQTDQIQMEMPPKELISSYSVSHLADDICPASEVSHNSVRKCVSGGGDLLCWRRRVMPRSA